MRIYFLLDTENSYADCVFIALNQHYTDAKIVNVSLNFVFVILCTALYCNVPVIANGTADRTVVQFTHSVTYSCQEGQGIVGDATPNCTADGNLTSVPYCDGKGSD